MTIETDRVDQLVNLERGEIDRRIFSDPEIFERELTTIFARSWLFLCHESQIKKKGDFFEAPMGRDNVLVVRQKDGGIKGLLNTCAHRGNAVCRAEEGNAKNFMCTYHGWTYDLAGDLIGVPGLSELYHDEMPATGLREVAQLESYRGFVFATMDATAPPLEEFLGRTGRLGLEFIASQGDMEAVPGIQKFIIPCNWKFAVDNLFDWYHPQITHLSAFQTGLLPTPPDGTGAQMKTAGVVGPDGADLQLPGGVVSGDAGDQLVFIDAFGHAIAGPTVEAMGNFGGMIDHSWRDRPDVVERLGPVARRSVGHANIFPTCWVTPPFNQISLRIPRGPMETEIWWFTFVHKDAPPEQRAMAVQGAIHAFGPAGFLEQEDGENWTQSTMQTLGAESKRVPQVLAMNLRRGKVVNDEDGLDPPYIECSINEHGQLWTFAAWQEWLRGTGWDELRERTAPPDVL
ncbi:Rieske 2Fe-2S domain-containing protein [Pseudonocardia sp. KRD-184]|uniref:Rieske 2Fe-2S domain-containing protein n=1 Tax=Pseudonocardia oceani TaxID=2792013 RepID=A0ABS6U2E4_9PSEU|nr:aromatic ring-hydroxylating dioxygenase subunit alpha [Pseudonocardia oceani]MBW0088142.1 Rieske 2Fe-2S domain-containing protein [Pseudonocardia oceani]MBW0095091.1 Rieske 2Fe-2S domain-containing protein [Pseudonocardia oceani]MBW0107172.1 Rieske 2Fe-2S domain-containing protein [Pseudonocardia oceani]MBW0119732.1 Rieske 2Fe-2S domain-containing protein [Pseudonocardia oceani]MBW0126395.1 Rieske 2Fe-2S domain-containing protein [Pseudonocardia oceani]